MAREGQRVGVAAAAQRIERDIRDVGLRADLLQHLPRIQLVLAGQDRFRRRAGQAAALGHQCRHQRTLKFMMRQHAGPALAPRTAGLQIGKAVDIETRNAELAEQPGGIEATPVETQCRVLQPRMGDGVIVLVKQQADAARRRWGWGSQACFP